MRHRVLPQRIRIRPDGERRTARQADAGMIARAGVGVHAETRAHHAAAARNGALLLGTLAALPIQHAFRGCDDDLGALLGRGHRLLERAAFMRVEIVGAIDDTQPFDADALYRLGDRMFRALRAVTGARGENVLAARGRRIAVVDDHQHIVGFIEHPVADARGEAVVPEAAIAHHRDGALALSPHRRPRRRPHPARSPWSCCRD